MSSTRAASISSPPARSRAPGVHWLVVWTLACCAWFVVAPRLWAIDLVGTGGTDSRDEAARDLEQAGENVEIARTEAAAARQRLDAFLSRHFEQQRLVEPPVPATPVEPDTNEVQLPNPELAQLETELQELRAHRRQLLGYLTEEHPQVFDVDERIAVIERQIVVLARVATERDDEAAQETAQSEQRWSEYLDRLARQGEQDAAEYRQLYDDWQSAEFAVRDALEAETLATRRLEALAGAQAPVAESGPLTDLADVDPDNRATPEANGTLASEPSGDTADGQHNATSSGGSPPSSDSAGSQPLALAALLIALAVAALAAVRLARSTSDPLFASADEVAAALAIPVVGIIPATAARLERNNSVAGPPRHWIVLAQILLAVLVFATIAYAVQNPGELWRFCSQPFETVGSFVRSLSGGQ